MDLGTILRTLREKRNLTQMDVMRKLKVSQTYISQLENGKREPSLPMLRRFGKLYKLPPQIIQVMAMEESDVPKQNKALYVQLKPVIDDMIEQLIAK
jgi:transcriptional regulator with XRE-family HTH domain